MKPDGTNKQKKQFAENKQKLHKTKNPTINKAKNKPAVVNKDGKALKFANKKEVAASKEKTFGKKLDHEKPKVNVNKDKPFKGKFPKEKAGKGPLEKQKGSSEKQRGPSEKQRGPSEKQKGPLGGQKGPLKGKFQKGEPEKGPFKGKKFQKEKPADVDDKEKGKPKWDKAKAKEREEAERIRAENKKKRMEKKKILYKKTNRGQPSMKGRIELLLKEIQTMKKN